MDPGVKHLDQQTEQKIRTHNPKPDQKNFHHSGAHLSRNHGSLYQISIVMIQSAGRFSPFLFCVQSVSETSNHQLQTASPQQLPHIPVRFRLPGMHLPDQRFSRDHSGRREWKGWLQVPSLLARHTRCLLHPEP